MSSQECDLQRKDAIRAKAGNRKMDGRSIITADHKKVIIRHEESIQVLVTKTDPKKLNKEQHRSLLSMAPGKVTTNPKHVVSACCQSF